MSTPEVIERRMLLAVNAGQTAVEAALAAKEVLREIALQDGEDPAVEVVMKGPGHVGPGYFVAYESGPAMWGAHVAMVLTVCTGRLVETHYGCDLCFYDGDGYGDSEGNGGVK